MLTFAKFRVYVGLSRSEIETKEVGPGSSIGNNTKIIERWPIKL